MLDWPSMRWRSLFVLLLAAVIAAGSTARPDFSGVWILNLQKSHIKDAPAASTFIIRHHEPDFHIRRTHVYGDGKQNTWGIDLVTDGKHTVTQRSAPYTTVTRMYWEGDVLVFDQKITADDGTSGTNVVRYSLSPDKQTFTATEHDETPDGKWTNVWIFDRKGSKGQ